MSDNSTRTFRRSLKWVLAPIIVGSVIVILVSAFLRGKQEAAAEQEQEQPPAAASRVRTEDGQTFETIDSSTQSKSGIETRALASTSQHQQLRANGVVLPIQNLTQLRTTYLSEIAEVDKAKSALEASQPEYERLKQLYENEQNAAAKTVQAAEATFHSDQVNLRAAKEALQLSQVLARQTWGEVVGEWISSDPPMLDSILAQKDLLLQVSFSLGVSVDPPAVSVQLPSGKIQPAEFISAYPAVDPRVQSPSFLYRTPSTPELAPGMTLVILLPTGPSVRGVLVPSGAIVWWQGKAWAYVQTAPERFSRREISTDTPLPSGWFVAAGFTPGERIVVHGAQELLSEEFRSQIQSLYEGGEEEKH